MKSRTRCDVDVFSFLLCLLKAALNDFDNSIVILASDVLFSDGILLVLSVRMKERASNIYQKNFPALSVNQFVIPFKLHRVYGLPGVSFQGMNCVT